MTSIENRQLFFRQMTVFGGVVLLCGIGIFIFEHNNNEPSNNAIDIAAVLPKNEMDPAIEIAAAGQSKSVWSSATLSESSVSDSGSTIPVADIAAVQDSVAHSSEQTISVWNRPAADSYSPWNTSAKQRESSMSAPEVAAVPSPPVEGVPVTSSPAPPIAAVEMTPMTPLSMPVSPYERQLLVAQTAAPARAPVDPFIQTGNSLVPGMVQTHERLENPVNTIPQNGVPQSMTVQPQYPPITAAPARVPSNTLPQGNGNNIRHGQYGQYDQYVAPPNGTLPNTPSQNMPIPSGVSTLQQGGYYPQPAGTAAVQERSTQNDNFYPNVSPAYRRVY